jgi:uncharacterized protein with von Willebrand factor type A (vWA) domain
VVRDAHAAPRGQLLHNVLLFGRVLRGVGLDAGPGRMIDLARALEHVSIGRRGDFRDAARCLLVHRREDLPLFEEAFAAFWRKPSEGQTSLDLSALGERRRFRRPRFEAPALPGRAPGGSDREPPRAEPPVMQPTLTWSAREVLRHKDFAELTEEELAELQRMIAALVWRPAERRSRRKRPGPGGLADLRRTLRRSLRHGGEILRWEEREPAVKPRPLVVLADISGSMERYTRLLLFFLYGLASGLGRRVEAFLFGTRLTRVTRELAGRDPRRAIAEVSRAVPDWSGGTRIGESLKTFNFRWGRRVLSGGAVVLVVSDGWDRGDTELLAAEMARLQRSCHRLIWLNPLLGSPDYEPLTRGIQAALPYVDDFLPVHDLASLEDLARRLESLPPRRPARRQQKAVGSP